MLMKNKCLIGCSNGSDKGRSNMIKLFEIYLVENEHINYWSEKKLKNICYKCLQNQKSLLPLQSQTRNIGCELKAPRCFLELSTTRVSPIRPAPFKPSRA